MNKILVLISTFLSLTMPAMGAVECYYHFTDEVLEITPEMKINSCTADFVWGFENVCFTGDISELASLINSGYYRWGHSLRVEDAQVINEDLIEYTGVDAQSFYSNRFNLERCKQK